MKTSHIWRKCLVKELNIPEPWKNLDCLDCQPARKDIFWVIASRNEVLEQLNRKIRSIMHLIKVSESINRSPASQFQFIIARDSSYIQYYPYLNLNTAGSLWHKFSETGFTHLDQLQHLEIAG